MTATLLPNAKQTFLDGNGKPLAGGSVYFYIPNTSTFKSTWQDPAQTILNTNPIILDAAGEATIWGAGTYRQVVYDVDGNLIWDQITEDTSGGLIGSITDAVFVAGTDFTPGTTTQLTLPAGPGSLANTWIFFDGVYQIDDTVASLNGVTLTFNSPIPVGVNEVTVKIGTTVAIGIPPAGSVTDITVASNANINSSKLSFLQAGTGAVRRTVQSKLQDVVSVKDFGAKGDGSTDDTAAMQAAHNTGNLVYYPKGTYLFTTLSMTNGGIVGEGQIATNLTSTDTTSADVITFNGGNLGSGLNPPIFRDFLLQGTATKTAGSGLVITSASNECENAFFENLVVQQFPVCINFLAAATWSMMNCNISHYLNAGVEVANTFNPDSGDSVMMGCQFGTAAAGSPVGVLYRSSGGLKIVGNKFNGGAFGILLGLIAPSSTSDLVVVGNSIENMSDTAISLNRSSGSAFFSNVQIGENQLAGNLNGIVVDNSGFLSNVNIGPNDIVMRAGGGGSAINLGVVDSYSIARQTIVGNGGSNNGIVIGSGCTNGKVTLATCKNITQPFVRGSGTCFFVRDRQVGNSSGTTTTAYGSLFSVNVPVIFSTQFAVAPEVNAQVSSNSGTGVSVLVPSSGISTTGFTATLIGTANGANIPFTWQADGVI